MTDLSKASLADLQAELERRSRSQLVLPEPLASPEYTALHKTITDGVARSIAARYEDEDFQHYVYEAAMEAVYGKGYWAWRRGRRW